VATDYAADVATPSRFRGYRVRWSRR